MCVAIKLTSLPTPFVPRGAQGGPGQHPGVQYSADIFIYLLTTDMQEVNNQLVPPDNHIHIYPCTKQDNTNRTGCTGGGVRKSFPYDLEEVVVGWKLKNGDLQCGNGALCGILNLFNDAGQLHSYAREFYKGLTKPKTHFENANKFKMTITPICF